MQHAGFPVPRISIVAVVAGIPAKIAAACRVMLIQMGTCSQLSVEAVEKADVAVGESVPAKIAAACRVSALYRADALCRVAVACRTMPMHMDTFPQSSGQAVEKPDVASLGSGLLGTACWNFELESRAG